MEKERLEVSAMDRKIVLYLIGFIAFVIFLNLAINLYTEFLWFESLQLESVFVSMLFYKISFFLILFIVSLAFFSINHFALHKASHEFLGEPFKISFWIDLLLSLLIALVFSHKWLQYVYFTNSIDFNLRDPIFGLDSSFYVFRLPFIQTALSLFFTLLLLAILISIAYYIFVFRWVKSFEEFKELFPQIGYIHLALLLASLFILIAIYFYFARFDLLTSPHGVVAGAGYTDIHVRLPAMGIVAFLSILFAAICVYLGYTRNIEAMVALPIVFVVIVFLALVATPLAIQKFKVEPNELAMEEEYIGYSINFTRFAYGLNVKSMPYAVEETLSIDAIERNRGIIENIRLWDHRPLVSVYRQIQQIRTYYFINDVDVDRYYIDGRYTQIMISARELSTGLLPPKAKTWVNQHLIFTHGYGVVGSAVNAVSEEGLPELIIEDIPPKGKITVKRPEIYFGELTNDYVVVKTLQKEFDYPYGEENVFTSYNGSGGVNLDSYFKKLLFAMRFGDVNLLLSNYVTTESRIMIHRNIKERVSAIAPFLQFDRDPYIAVIDGKLYWIIDAYTTLSNFPYSAKQYSFNYIRNPVKVFVDAYNGSVEFFVIQEEPVIGVLMKAFPELFVMNMDEEKREHIRYPVGMFGIQAQIYATYHMDVRAFYNREDVWEIPKELFEELRIEMEPYYVIVTLPESDKPEFLLMLPFTPKGRDNIIAWMAARCDERYGELMLYEFPKGKLIYGPMQIEARIDQDAEISKLFTLWGQAGSRIIRGNLLVIPIEKSIIYVEPVYLRAENVQIPELRGVIVAYNDKLAMRPTLDGALATLFGEKLIPTQKPEVEVEGVEELIRLSIDIYRKAMEEAKAGNWSGFGEMVEKLGETLEKLNQTI